MPHLLFDVVPGVTASVVWFARSRRFRCFWPWPGGDSEQNHRDFASVDELCAALNDVTSPAPLAVPLPTAPSAIAAILTKGAPAGVLDALRRVAADHGRRVLVIDSAPARLIREILPPPAHLLDIPLFAGPEPDPALRCLECGDAADLLRIPILTTPSLPPGTFELRGARDRVRAVNVRCSRSVACTALAGHAGECTPAAAPPLEPEPHPRGPR